MAQRRPSDPVRLLPAVVVILALAVGPALVGPVSAAAAPVVTYECTPEPENCSGWYRSNVTIEWTVIPSSATVVAGCQKKTLSTDTELTTEFCSARDGTGARTTVEVDLQLDKTAPTVTGGQPGRGADVNGWYNHPVGVSFSGSDQTSGIAFCSAPTYAGPDSGAASLSGTCTDVAGNRSAPFPYGLKYDGSAPVIAGANPERPANAAGWFNRPVRFDLQASDPTSGLADCASVTYSGPDAATGSFSGSCRDQAGNLASRGFGLKYDATAPAATGAEAGRGPDHNGWYTRPVSIAFIGSDETSGIASCSAPTYAGPDSGAASVLGSCVDMAGNIGSPLGRGLRYDATAPGIATLAAKAGDRRVGLRWETTSETASLEVARRPGLGSESRSVVFRGGGDGFEDKRVANGVRYVYEVYATDAAGNTARRSVAAVPGRRLLAPGPKAAVVPGERLLFKWTQVRRASYYNLQLFREGRKVLSVWPSKPRYRLKAQWTHRGRSQRLIPGQYRWLVWPGYGQRSKSQYGERIGPATFRVRG